MKPSILHKSFSVVLSLLVLFSTLSFTVEKHFCGDTLVDVAVFSEAKKCGMQMDADSTMKKHCCKDEVELIQGQDELKTTSFSHLDVEQQKFLVAYVYSYATLLEYLPKRAIPHKDYAPPNLVTDIQLLDQVFLI